MTSTSQYIPDQQQSVQGTYYCDKCTVCHLDRAYDYKNLKIWLLPTVYIVQIAIMKMCDERCFKNCWGPPSSTLKIEFDSPSHNSCSCIYSKQQFCDLPHLSSTTHYIVYNIKLVDLGANCCELAYVLFSRRVTLHRVTKHYTCMWMGHL